MELQGLHGQVVDRIGLSLAADEIRAGEVLRLEDVQERYGVSAAARRPLAGRIGMSVPAPVAPRRVPFPVVDE
ncbi:hypothetical protein ACWCOW_40775, partial [Streptomyces sp. NPDC001939]